MANSFVRIKDSQINATLHQALMNWDLLKADYGPAAPHFLDGQGHPGFLAYTLLPYLGLGEAQTAGMICHRLMYSHIRLSMGQVEEGINRLHELGLLSVSELTFGRVRRDKGYQFRSMRVRAAELAWPLRLYEDKGGIVGVWSVHVGAQHYRYLKGKPLQFNSPVFRAHMYVAQMMGLEVAGRQSNRKELRLMQLQQDLTKQVARFHTKLNQQMKEESNQSGSGII